MTINGEAKSSLVLARSSLSTLPPLCDLLICVSSVSVNAVFSSSVAMVFLSKTLGIREGKWEREMGKEN